MKYIVIIGDIIGSKEISNRKSIQKLFADVLQEPSKIYTKTIISPLTLTIGDEFQAVLSNAENLFQMMAFIEHKMRKISLRYGLGIGEIDTEINRQSAIGMDGPAFHFARQAVEIARKEEKIYHFKCKNKSAEDRINILMNWLDLYLKKWTDQKKEILYYQQKKMTQKEIARQMGMTQPAVSQNIKGKAFSLITETQKLVEQELNSLVIRK
jgi:predicted DNA-binding protein YlxM (UPF0122 family)